MASPPLPPLPIVPTDRDPRRGELPWDIDSFLGRQNLLLDTACPPVFARAVMAEITKRPRPRRVLDIGCGHGIGRVTTYQEHIRDHVDQYWGVEPDTSVEIPEGIWTEFRPATLETADLPADYFDVAYAMFVLEHVSRPEPFMREVARVLRPDGVFLFLTTNGSALFGRVSRLLSAGMQDRILGWMGRGSEVEHYAVSGGMNRPRVLEELAQAAGFRRTDLAFFQFDGTQSYFPGPFRLFYHALLARRRLFGNPRSLDNILGRLTK